LEPNKGRRQNFREESREADQRRAKTKQSIKQANKQTNKQTKTKRTKRKTKETVPEQEGKAGRCMYLDGDVVDAGGRGRSHIGGREARGVLEMGFWGKMGERRRWAMAGIL
jgi:predicted ATPase